jgi:hypothetical protein
MARWQVKHLLMVWSFIHKSPGVEAGRDRPGLVHP